MKRTCETGVRCPGRKITSFVAICWLTGCEQTIANHMNDTMSTGVPEVAVESLYSSGDLKNATSWSSDEDDDDEEVLDEDRLSAHVAVVLIKYFFPIILVTGTVGNILSVVVLQRKAMRTSCSSVYLIVLAVTDGLVLYASGLKVSVRSVYRLSQL